MTKTITFAVMHFAIAFAVTWLLTGDPLVGGLVALVEPAVNTVAFHFHERIWQRLGRQGRGLRPPHRRLREAVAGS